MGRLKKKKRRGMQWDGCIYGTCSVSPSILVHDTDKWRYFFSVLSFVEAFSRTHACFVKYQSDLLPVWQSIDRLPSLQVQCLFFCVCEVRCQQVWRCRFALSCCILLSPATGPSPALLLPVALKETHKNVSSGRQLSLVRHYASVFSSTPCTCHFLRREKCMVSVLLWSCE